MSEQSALFDADVVEHEVEYVAGVLAEFAWKKGKSSAKERAAAIAEARRALTTLRELQ